MTLKLPELVIAYSLSNHTPLEGQQQCAPSDRTLGMSGRFLSFPNIHLTCHNLIELSPSLECLPSGQHGPEWVKWLTDAVVDAASWGDGESWASRFFSTQEWCPHCEPQSQHCSRRAVLTMRGPVASAFI